MPGLVKSHCTCLALWTHVVGNLKCHLILPGGKYKTSSLIQQSSNLQVGDWRTLPDFEGCAGRAGARVESQLLVQPR